VQVKVKALEELQLPVKADMSLLTGTQWTTVFTTSTGVRVCVWGGGLMEALAGM
jgi:hypothetical protein